MGFFPPGKLVCAGQSSLAVEVLIDGDQEGHDALGVWDLDGNHVINIQHLWDPCLPVMREREMYGCFTSHYI